MANKKERRKRWYRDGGRVIVQLYDPETRGPKKITRNLTKHLDNAGDDDIEKWIDLYISENRRQATRTLERVLMQNDEALTLFRSFISERAALRNLQGTTVEEEQRRFDLHIAPFFVRERKQKDVRIWEYHIPHLAQYLIDEGHLKTNQIKKVLAVLVRFSKYLTLHNIISKPWTPILPTANKQAPTPLEFDIKPEDVFSFCKTASDRCALMALLGYFGSLRPEETFAITESDFYTAPQAYELALTYPRFKKHGLGSGLSLHVNKALKKGGVQGVPKNHFSHGYVNIWSQQAANTLAKLLPRFQNRPLCDGRSRDTLFKYWQRHGKSRLKVTLHDLRRASGVYLGRTLDLPIFLLQDHLRHGDQASTEAYTRKPPQAQAENHKRDYGNVG